MVLSAFEIEQAAALMAEGCMGKKWDEIKDEKVRERYRKSVTNIASVYDVPRTEQSVKQFMNWVGHKVPRHDVDLMTTKDSR